jgi:hypothetical protein
MEINWPRLLFPSLFLASTLFALNFLGEGFGPKFAKHQPIAKVYIAYLPNSSRSDPFRSSSVSISFICS